MLRYVIVVLIGVALLSCAPVIALRWMDPPTTAFMLLDSSGERPLAHRWVDWSSIADTVPLAVVASEDQKFAEHFGFDVSAIQSSLEAYENGARLRGASTISQQVAKNLFLWPERSFLRKGLEAYFTLVIELCWPKRRILEVYLNVAEFGRGVYGVGAASTRFFGKDASELSMHEAALLAAVLPSPKRLRADAPSPYVTRRADWIVSHMGRLQRAGWMSRVR